MQVQYIDHGAASAKSFMEVYGAGVGTLKCQLGVTLPRMRVVPLNISSNDLYLLLLDVVSRTHERFRPPPWPSRLSGRAASNRQRSRSRSDPFDRCPAALPLGLVRHPG